MQCLAFLKLNLHQSFLHSSDLIRRIGSQHDLTLKHFSPAVKLLTQISAFLGAARFVPHMRSAPSKSSAPRNIVCGSVRARSTKNSWRASEDSGAGRRWGLFWWRGSINIALPPPRLLVCLAAVTRTLQCSGDGTRALMAVSAQLQQRKLSFFSHSFRRRVRSDVEGSFVMKSTRWRVVRFPNECSSCKWVGTWKVKFILTNGGRSSILGKEETESGLWNPKLGTLSFCLIRSAAVQY